MQSLSYLYSGELTVWEGFIAHFLVKVFYCHGNRLPLYSSNCIQNIYSSVLFIMHKNTQSWVKMSNYALKLFIQQQPFPKVIMGFDIGVKSTGISITSSDLRHAFYLTTLSGDLFSRNIIERATRLILKEKPIALVIGKPSYVTQAKHHANIIQSIENWVEEMSRQHPKTQKMHFTFVDELYTTLSAKQQLRKIESQIKYWGHLRKQKDLVDGMAAINILRKYLDFYNQKG